MSHVVLLGTVIRIHNNLGLVTTSALMRPCTTEGERILVTDTLTLFIFIRVQLNKNKRITPHPCPLSAQYWRSAPGT